MSPADLQDLHDRPSEELRELAAHIAGVLAHRHGDAEAAAVFGRIGAALCIQFVPKEQTRAH
jgi:hypothetical protein